MSAASQKWRYDWSNVIQLRLVGPVHGWGGVEVEAVSVPVAQGEEVGRRDEGIVDGMQGLPGNRR